MTPVRLHFQIRRTRAAAPNQEQVALLRVQGVEMPDQPPRPLFNNAQTLDRFSDCPAAGHLLFGGHTIAAVKTSALADDAHMTL